MIGTLLVLAIGIWDVGLPGHATPFKPPAKVSVSASPTPSGSVPEVPDVAGVIHPKGAPEFDASFTGSRLNTSVWSTCYPWIHDGGGCTNFGNAKTEHEWYLPSQDRVYGGSPAPGCETRAHERGNRHGRPGAIRMPVRDGDKLPKLPV